MAEDVHIDSYDEDLAENSFFKYLQGKHKSLYDEVASYRWTICIPRKGTLSRSNHTQYDVENHILQPVENSSSLFKTMSSKSVQVNEGFIITTEGFKDVKSVRILFQETFFNSSNESFQILCLDQPLEGGIGVSAEPVVQTLETLQDCIDFLWPSTGTKQGQKQIDEIIKLFNSTYQQLEGESLRHLMDATNAIYTRAMQGALKNWQLRKLARNDKNYLDNVKLAIETYVMHGLHGHLMKGISAIIGNEDAALNKITRNLAEIQIRDIGIRPEICTNLPKARRILSLLNKYTSPLEKFHCLKKSITVITERKLKENEQGSGDAVTADDLLPALVFLAIKSDIPNWLANITFLHNFHFSKCGYSEFQFYLSSLEAAVEHVRSGYISKAFKGGTPFKRLHNEVPGLLWQQVDYDSSRPTALDMLFKFASEGNDVEVEKLLAHEEEDQLRLDKMCHPLCSCDKCEKLLSSKRNDPSAVTVFSRDDMGRTVLHVSAEYGHANLTYALIHKGAVVNAMDYHGTTPLHLACLRGHNKVVLLLAHYKSDANAPDNDGNTPLHLCAANGHAQSLKSLMYCDMQANVLKINAGNENGDTPLHLASRWGYVDIVNQLIEKGASVEARNKNRETPLECAHNQQVSDLLLDVTASNIDMESDFTEQSSKSLDIPRSPSRSSLAGSPSSSIDRTAVREVGMFLRTVADGDLAMVRYRLGLEDEEEEDEDGEMDCRSEQDLCHPLCQCEKCSKWQKLTQRSLELAVHANCANEDGISPIHVAAVRGYEDITSLLLRHGANANHRNTTRQQTALHLACQYNHPNVVELLLNHQAKINAKDYKGNTPLHFCCINGHVGPTIVLLQCKANVDAVNDRGNTPLHEAARWNFVELVRLLLRYRASVTIQNKMQLTPLQYAKHDDVVRILESAERRASSVVRTARVSTWTAMASKVPNTIKTTPSDSFEVKGMVSGSPPRKHAVQYTADITQASDVTSASIPCVSADGTMTTGRFESTREPGSSPARDPAGPARPRTFSDGSMCDTTVAAPQTKLSQIFEQLEGGDIEKLQEIAKAVRAFDRRKSLKRAVTIDKSSPLLGAQRPNQVPIDFEKTALFKTDSIDENDPSPSTKISSGGNLMDRVRRAISVEDELDGRKPERSRADGPLLERIRRLIDVKTEVLVGNHPALSEENKKLIAIEIESRNEDSSQTRNSSGPENIADNSYFGRVRDVLEFAKEHNEETSGSNVQSAGTSSEEDTSIDDEELKLKDQSANRLHDEYVNQVEIVDEEDIVDMDAQAIESNGELIGEEDRIIDDEEDQFSQRLHEEYVNKVEIVDEEDNVDVDAQANESNCERVGEEDRPLDEVTLEDQSSDGLHNDCKIVDEGDIVNVDAQPSKADREFVGKDDRPIADEDVNLDDPTSQRLRDKIVDETNTGNLNTQPIESNRELAEDNGNVSPKPIKTKYELSEDFKPDEIAIQEHQIDYDNEQCVVVDKAPLDDQSKITKSTDAADVPTEIFESDVEYLGAPVTDAKERIKQQLGEPGTAKNVED